MNYIYDIYANLNDKYYDIYEWLKKDTIMHIKKIPVFKITNNDLINIIKNDIKLNIEFFNLVKNKTEFFNLKKKLNLCIFTDSKDNILVQISDDGNIIQKSDIHFTDKIASFDTLKKINLFSLDYHIRKKIPLQLYDRNEQERKNYLLKKINLLDQNKLAYLYFECFNQKQTNEELIKKRIRNEILQNNEKICSTINIFLKLICAL